MIRIDQFTDSELLLVVLAIFYLAECMTWASHDAVCFVVRRRLSAVCRLGGFVLRNSKGGFSWTSFSPAASSFLTQTWPVAVSPEGVHSYVSQTLNENGHADSTDVCLSWDEVKNLEVDRHDVFIDGRRFVKGCSPRMARFLADRLDCLATSDDRAAAIDQLFAEITDVSRVKELLDRFRRKTHLLGLLCRLLLIYTFVAGAAFLVLFNWLPLAVQMSGWQVLGVYVLLWWTTVLVAYRVQRDLTSSLKGTAPDSVLPLTSETMVFLFSSLFLPISAIRSVHVLSKEWLATYHPLAVAAVLMSKPDFARLARRTLLDIRYPMRSPWIVRNEQKESIEAWYTSRLETTLVRLVESTGEDPARLTTPPSAETHDAVTYCPRCGGQYRLESGTCGVCHGVSLQRF